MHVKRQLVKLLSSRVERGETRICEIDCLYSILPPCLCTRILAMKSSFVPVLLKLQDMEKLDIERCFNQLHCESIAYQFVIAGNISCPVQLIT